MSTQENEWNYLLPASHNTHKKYGITVKWVAITSTLYFSMKVTQTTNQKDTPGGTETKSMSYHNVHTQPCFKFPKLHIFIMSYLLTYVPDLFC